MTQYQIKRHVSGACWLVYCDGRCSTTFPTRAEARDYIRQQRSLETRLNEFDQMVASFMQKETAA